MNLTPANLISLCEEAVVPCEKWNDRDSASAQNGLCEIYRRLKADIPFTYTIDDSGDTIWISFVKPTLEQIEKMNSWLNIDYVSDYRERVSSDDEMFEPVYVSDKEAFSSYMPTQKKLDSVFGEDWY